MEVQGANSSGGRHIGSGRRRLWVSVFTVTVAALVVVGVFWWANRTTVRGEIDDSAAAVPTTTTVAAPHKHSVAPPPVGGENAHAVQPPVSPLPQPTAPARAPQATDITPPSSTLPAWPGGGSPARAEGDTLTVFGQPLKLTREWINDYIHRAPSSPVQVAEAQKVTEVLTTLVNDPDLSARGVGVFRARLKTLGYTVGPYLEQVFDALQSLNEKTDSAGDHPVIVVRTLQPYITSIQNQGVFDVFFHTMGTFRLVPDSEADQWREQLQSAASKGLAAGQGQNTIFVVDTNKKTVNVISGPWWLM